MKSTCTFKNLLGASLLIFSGSVLSFAQSNSTAGSPIVTSQSRTFTLSIDEDMMKAGTMTATSIVLPNLQSGESKRDNGKLLVDINVPDGTPVGTTVTLRIDGKPLWHVTVADILGQTEGDETNPSVAMRPIDITNVASGGDTDPNATTVSTPNAATASTGVNKSQPKMDLYPNPATEHVTIVTEGEVLWGVAEVIDITGKKVFEVFTGANVPSAGINNLTVIVSQLKPGTYFLRFKTDKDIYTKRFQVAK